MVASVNVVDSTTNSTVNPAAAEYHPLGGDVATATPWVTAMAVLVLLNSNPGSPNVG